MTRATCNLSAEQKQALTLCAAKLKTSYLTMAQGAELGMRACTPTQTKALNPKFAARYSLQIVYVDPIERDEPFYRLRYLDEEPPSPARPTKAKPMRYVQPAKMRPYAYFPTLPSVDWPALLADPTRSLLITEGELKAAKACADGFPCIGLGGVWSFKAEKKFGINFLPELKAIEWREREVYLVYDSDVKTNPETQRAAHALGAKLTKLGASVRYVFLPDVLPAGAKTGLDDFLGRKGANALDSLLEAATPHAGRSGRATNSKPDTKEPQRTNRAPTAAGASADPLDGLIEKAAVDPGAPFAPEVVARLAALKKDDLAAFEALRSKLKQAGVRITVLDKAVAEEGGAGGRPTQADILIELAQAAELFHAPDRTGFADLDVNGHRETWTIRSKGFRHWLARRYFESTNGAPSSEAMKSALELTEAKAHFDAPERAVYIRVGGLDDRLYLDLGDEDWRAVEIDATGWRVIDKPPVRFRRAAGMQPLPSPVRGGSIELLRPFLNVAADHDFVLVAAWLVSCLRNVGPYPVIVLSGEQGSAKSTFSTFVRSLIDPNTAPLRALPQEDRDLFIAANNAHVLAFDNVSGLPAYISDTLCRLATGGGFAVRQLYSDSDETLFDAARPIILNGITEIVTRSDLADRAMFLRLEPIPEERRRPEKELLAEFEAQRPRVLGALLDAVVQGLKRLPKTRLAKLPRMADFALWATACETAMWPAGTFGQAYDSNIGEAVESVLEANPVATAVRAMMDKLVPKTVGPVGPVANPAPRGPSQKRTPPNSPLSPREVREEKEWKGTATALLTALDEHVDDRVKKSKYWPDGSRALSGRLRRAATFLRKVGIEISFDRGDTRDITITKSAPREVGKFATGPTGSTGVAPKTKKKFERGYQP